MREINRARQSFSTWGEPILVLMGTSRAATTALGKVSDLLVVHSPKMNNENIKASSVLLKSNIISSQAKTNCYSWLTALQSNIYLLIPIA